MFTFSDYLAERTLYVYDSSSNKVTELDTKDELAMQRFDNKYNFHEDTLSDIPKIKGVRRFETDGNTIIVSSDPQAIAAEVEEG